jgi:hypothetical protein
MGMIVVELKTLSLKLSCQFVAEAQACLVADVLIDAHQELIDVVRERARTLEVVGRARPGGRG